MPAFTGHTTGREALGSFGSRCPAAPLKEAPKEPGHSALLGCAKDANGTVQPDEHDWNYGSYVITHLLPDRRAGRGPRAPGTMRLGLGAEMDL
jgi:hypothetical protein